MLFRKRYRLGIDFGTHRMRVALTRESQNGCRLVAVATRDQIPTKSRKDDEEQTVGHLRDMVTELHAHRAAAICSIPATLCSVRSESFPAMSAVERRSAAYVLATLQHPDETEIAMCMEQDPDSSNAYVIGSSARTTIDARIRILRQARLIPVAIEPDGQALARLYVDADAIIDIGGQTSSIHVRGNSYVQSSSLNIGSDELTNAIATELGLERGYAQRRKHIVGMAGAGDRAKHALLRGLCELVRKVRSEATSVRSVALVGNGARIDGIGEALESSAQISIVNELPTAFYESDYPVDVMRSARWDWSLCVGLSLHEMLAS